MNPIVIAAGSAFGAFALGLVVRAFIVRATENDPLAQSKAGIPGASIPVKTITSEDIDAAIDKIHDLKRSSPHEHEWRAITEFVRQCRDRNCGEVLFLGDVPDGLSDYVRLMTSRKAREDPNGEAGHYFEADSRMWGPRCQSCGRPLLENNHNGLGQPVDDCPYCGKSGRLPSGHDLNLGSAED